MKFSITEDGRLEGPKQYMDERGSDLMTKIVNGNDDQFSAHLRHSPDTETALLTRMQTDYADWKGMKDLEAKTDL